MENEYIGTHFDDFLAEEDILEESQETAFKRILAYMVKEGLYEK